MPTLVKYSESMLAELKVDKVYLVWKDRYTQGDRFEYTAPTGAVVNITGCTRDAQEYYGVDTMYWAEFAGFSFGVTEEEVEFIG